MLAQAIVAVAKRFPDKSVRSATAVFSRAVMVGAPVELDIDVFHEGRSTATAVVTALQNGKRAITITVLADVPTDDVIRHELPKPQVAAPADANVSAMAAGGPSILSNVKWALRFLCMRNESDLTPQYSALATLPPNPSMTVLYCAVNSSTCWALTSWRAKKTCS